MGLRLGLRLQDVQRPLQGLHGQSQLPAEALPTLDDAPLGRRGHGEPFRRDGRRPANAGADPNCPGSLGIAISEAVETAPTREDSRYTLGSVLNHVLLHQTVIGLEAEKQFQLIGDFPDVVLGCVGGGSNFAGLSFPFLRHKLEGRKIDFVACEPHSCPSMSRGQYRYDYGDTTKLTPLVKMHTLGHSFVPPGSTPAASAITAWPPWSAWGPNWG